MLDYLTANEGKRPEVVGNIGVQFKHFVSVDQKPEIPAGNKSSKSQGFSNLTGRWDRASLAFQREITLSFQTTPTPKI